MMEVALINDGPVRKAINPQAKTNFWFDEQVTLEITAGSNASDEK